MPADLAVLLLGPRQRNDKTFAALLLNEELGSSAVSSVV